MQAIRFLKHNSRGNVLVVGLFTLALLSLLGSAATTTSRTDVNITGNAKTLQEAFYAAEVGLAMGEMTIDQLTSPLDLEGAMPVGLYNKGQHPDWKDKELWKYGSMLMAPLEVSSGLDHLHERPRYTIERLGRDRTGYTLVETGERQPAIYKYKIRAKGTGGSSKTQSVLQSVFFKHFD